MTLSSIWVVAEPAGDALTTTSTELSKHNYTDVITMVPSSSS
jgi:hypothetical protein